MNIELLDAKRQKIADVFMFCWRNRKGECLDVRVPSGLRVPFDIALGGPGFVRLTDADRVQEFAVHFDPEISWESLVQPCGKELEWRIESLGMTL